MSSIGGVVATHLWKPRDQSTALVLHDKVIAMCVIVNILVALSPSLSLRELMAIAYLLHVDSIPGFF